MQLLCCLLCLSCSSSCVASVSARHLALSPAPASSRLLSPSSLSAVSSIAKHAQGTGTRPAAPPTSSDARGTAEETPCLSEPRQDLRCHELPRATAPSSRRSRELPRSPPQPVWCVQRPRTPGPRAHTSPSPSRNIINTEPRQVHKQQHPGTTSSKSFAIFSTSVGSRRGGKGQKWH